MPRIRQKAGQYRTADFLKELELAKVRCGIRTDRELAELVGVSKRVIGYQKRNPDRMPVELLRTIATTLNMDPAAVLSFLGLKMPKSTKEEQQW